VFLAISTITTTDCAGGAGGGREQRLRGQRLRAAASRSSGHALALRESL